MSHRIFNSISSCIESFITDEKIQIFSTFCTTPKCLFTDTRWFSYSDHRWNNWLWLLIARISNLGISENDYFFLMCKPILNMHHMIVVNIYKTIYPVPTSITQAGKRPVIFLFCFVQSWKRNRKDRKRKQTNKQTKNAKKNVSHKTLENGKSRLLFTPHLLYRENVCVTHSLMMHESKFNMLRYVVYVCIIYIQCTELKLYCFDSSFCKS